MAVFLPLSAFGQTTIAPDAAFSYAANIGWLNARGDVAQGAVIGAAFLRGHVWSANGGWISLGNPSGPVNGWRYSNTVVDRQNDWGVNHDSEGRLFGCAWGANIGWVVFEQTHGCPRVNLDTGELSGYAWGANVGWIRLDGLRTERFDSGADSDADGLPDWWEYWRAGNLTTLAGGEKDADGDGETDVAEYRADTDPLAVSDRLRIVRLTWEQDVATLVWRVRMSRRYVVEAAGALAPLPNPQWQNISGNPLVPVSEPEMSWGSDEAGRSRRFYRVRPVVPLSGP